MKARITPITPMMMPSTPPARTARSRPAAAAMYPAIPSAHHAQSGTASSRHPTPPLLQPPPPPPPLPGARGFEAVPVYEVPLYVSAWLIVVAVTSVLDVAAIEPVTEPCVGDTYERVCPPYTIGVVLFVVAS